MIFVLPNVKNSNIQVFCEDVIAFNPKEFLSCCIPSSLQGVFRKLWNFTKLDMIIVDL